MAWAEVLVLADGVVVGDSSEVLPEEVLGVAVVVEEEVFEVEEFEAVDVDVFEAAVDWLDVDSVVWA